MVQQPVQPIFILQEGTQRSTGRDAQRNNIMAAKAVAETVRTTLGPKGMDKMLVSSLGDVVITNDGVTILEEMQIEHPAAKMLVEVAKTQENEVGDGTTTAVVLAGELLKNAEKLIDDNVHPTVIARGYRIAAEKARDLLENMAEQITEKDEALLKNIAITAMTGKGAEGSKELLAELCVKSVKQIRDNDGTIDLENIKIEKKIGGGAENSELVQGILIDKEKVHSAMPRMIKNAKIALLDAALEIKSPETDTKIQISTPDQLQAFLDQEEKILRNMVDKVIKSKANVIICQKGIDDIAQHYLAKAGVYAVRRVKKSDMDKLARATNAKIVSNLNDLNEQDLGYSGIVEEQKIGDEMMTFVKECKNPKAVTLLIRGGTEHVIAELERAVKDSLGDISASLKNKKVVAGAGAVEMELAKELRNYANKLSGKEQLAVLAFANSLEIIPRTLAENAGLDPVDMLTDLKSKHDANEGKWFGIDVMKGKLFDAWKAGVIEPLKIKTQAIQSASEVSELILRIDDVIAASGSKDNVPQMPPGGYGGME
ncbi:MAG: Thermosome, chaperonin Cpn60/TCP-1 [archaeon GW2011_AR20]|nr:MAG: Thermosome, chaperonin Cpn60/TCP-1 [archaeon GW2011_AR20]MBS3160214.1 TCP-1/cpn60 chaperonin family protein [Candidatus Woesearchaeota archaeon]